MKAIVTTESGGPEVLKWDEVADPDYGPREVVIKVAAAGVNRADIMQRRGFYPPPAGASNIIGLECSGTVSAVGDEVTDYQVGDRVCALLAGGGYAETVVVPEALVLPVPEGMDLVEAAAIVEVACTVWSNLYAPYSIGRLQVGETLLVHGGSSGIGTMAIQMAKAKDNPVIVTVGNARKAEFCLELGAEAAINYRDEDFVERVKEITDDRGADVILDVVGAKYLDRNIDALADDGRIVIIGMQGGNTGELQIGKLLGKRALVGAASLRGRAIEGRGGKADVVRGVRDDIWPLFDTGRLAPVIDSTMPMADAKGAHERMESSEHIGKIVLTI
ncbi:zinc-binding dehydrogenase [Epidermidibacterium keratini]|uniref:Zinc-binding dehydrogenase n=1 Tax=Epidermidibacterium keratini TaxID=1891644 RepID=A0A7L4YNB8_9ACTN|nr:NAD(P)H-quinone oxidoreductase [Epidermidibacterium keratini]QHC00765.1 zinc-binding dehydrogenase [Epidermidibacterium keratini]